jgi:hypothetical protein
MSSEQYICITVACGKFTQPAAFSKISQNPLLLAHNSQSLWGDFFVDRTSAINQCQQYGKEAA